MARGALIPERTSVWIGVATRATADLQSAEVRVLVTPTTVGSEVSAGKRVVRGGVIERSKVRPGGVGVTAFASLSAELFFVGVFSSVTTQARRGES